MNKLTNSDFIILGINWEQNSTASLMINGKIVGTASEERFSRVKNDERYPYRAINWLLNNFKISPKKISLVSFISKIWNSEDILTRHYTNFSIDDYVNEQKKIWYPRIYKKKSVTLIKVFPNKIDKKQFPGPQFWNKVIRKLRGKKAFYNKDQKIRSEVVELHLNVEKKKILFIDHSTGHASYAYFGTQASKGPSLILTLDAFGDNLNYTANVYRLKKMVNMKLKELAKDQILLLEDYIGTQH